MKHQLHLRQIETNETTQVRLECDADIALLSLILGDAGLGAGGHVLLPLLMVLETDLGVARLHNKTLTEDVGELSTIAVLTTDNLLLTLVIVTAGEQVTKDKFRGIHLVLGMLDDRNAITIILYADLEGTIGGSSNLDIDALYR